MEKREMKKVCRVAKLHGKILLRGAIRTLYGTAIFGALAGAVCGFMRVPGESGYTAVFDFLVAMGMLMVGIANLHEIGRKRGNRDGRIENQ